MNKYKKTLKAIKLLVKKPGLEVLQLLYLIGTDSRWK